MACSNSAGVRSLRSPGRCQVIIHRPVEEHDDGTEVVAGAGPSKQRDTNTASPLTDRITDAVRR